MNKKQNKRVQGTRHKVSGPLTRDVRGKYIEGITGISKGS